MKYDDFKANIYIYIYINFGIEFNIKKSKFKVSNHVRISKYKNSFVNGYQLSQIDEMFVIQNVKDTLPGTNCKREIECFRTEKVTREKDDK